MASAAAVIGTVRDAPTVRVVLFRLCVLIVLLTWVRCCHWITESLIGVLLGEVDM